MLDTACWLRRTRWNIPRSVGSRAILASLDKKISAMTYWEEDAWIIHAVRDLTG